MEILIIKIEEIYYLTDCADIRSEPLRIQVGNRMSIDEYFSLQSLQIDINNRINTRINSLKLRQWGHKIGE